jgi:hypothetical protein
MGRIGVMDILPHQIILFQYTTHSGPLRPEQYRALVDADMTSTEIVDRLMTRNFVAYLNRFFSGWKLLRRVEEIKKRPQDPPYKIVYFIVELGSEAAITTLRQYGRSHDLLRNRRNRTIDW